MNLINLKDEESLYLQILATTSLLAELSNNNFLDSDYFSKMNFSNNSFKEILQISSIGNPACLQMMLYALLVIPKEIDNNIFNTSYLNNMIDTLIENNSTFSNYNSDSNQIDYIRHFRNSISHSRCRYFNDKQGIAMVEFKDNNANTSESCIITIKCINVGKILEEIQKILQNYFKLKFNL